MKFKFFRYAFYTTAFVMALTGCKDDEPEIGEPFSKIEGITATGWQIAEAFLVDENNPAKPEQDISEYYTSSDNLLEINFSADGSYEVIEGDGIAFLPLTGTWSFNDNAAPTSIIFVGDNGEVITAPLDGPTRIVDSQLKIRFEREYCQIDGESKPVLGYRVVFNRIEE